MMRYPYKVRCGLLLVATAALCCSAVAAQPGLPSTNDRGKLRVHAELSGEDWDSIVADNAAELGEALARDVAGLLDVAVADVRVDSIAPGPLTVDFRVLSSAPRTEEALVAAFSAAVYTAPWLRNVSAVYSAALRHESLPNATLPSSPSPADPDVVVNQPPERPPRWVTITVRRAAVVGADGALVEVPLSTGSAPGRATAIAAILTALVCLALR